MGWVDGKEEVSRFFLCLYWEAQPVNGFLCRRLPTTEKRKIMVFTADSLSYVPVTIDYTSLPRPPASLPRPPAAPMTAPLQPPYSSSTPPLHPSTLLPTPPYPFAPPHSPFLFAMSTSQELSSLIKIVPASA